MKSQPTTNVTRMLGAKGIPHTVRTYDTSDGAVDAQSVAHKLAIPEQCLFKTLVARASGGVAAGKIFVFCIPGPTELDLSRAAQCCGAKTIDLVKVQELLPLTGYVRGGCSPLGLKRPYPIFLDRSAESCPQITISAGRVGVQVTLAPSTVIELTGAVYANLGSHRNS